VLVTIHLDSAGKIAGLALHDEESPADEAALTKFLTIATIDPAQFSPAVRSLVKVDELQAVRDQLKRSGGNFVKVTTSPGGYVAHCERMESHVLISTDASGLITLIFFQPSSARAK